VLVEMNPAALICPERQLFVGESEGIAVKALIPGLSISYL
jgi:hypothetical protein